MARPDNVFLTDDRQDVLNGDWEGLGSTRRSHLSNIRHRTRLALRELREVANSEEIDNAKVFDPDDLRALLEALLMDRVEGPFEHEPADPDHARDAQDIPVFVPLEYEPADSDHARDVQDILEDTLQQRKLSRAYHNGQIESVFDYDSD